MEDRRIQKAFQKTEPNETQLEKMWTQIEESVQTNDIKYKRLMGGGFAKMARSAAVVVICLLVGAVSINAATGGKVWEQVKELFSGDNQKIVDDISELPKTSAMEAFAPDISFIDENDVLFATKRGMLLFERKSGKLKGIVDLQKIGCFYFNTETKKTRVFAKGNQVIVFNEKNNVPEGKYYVYKIDEANVNTWKPAEEGTNQSILEEYYKDWEKYQKHYSDTFERRELRSDIKETENYEEYSENTFLWRDKDNKEYLSYFIINEDYKYELHTYDKATKAISKEVLMVDVKKTDFEKQGKSVPKFRYTGDDEVIKAICPYMESKTKKMYAMDKNCIWIPEFMIYEKVKKDGYLYVFGNFWIEYYQINGMIMESVAGGEHPARIKLKKTKQGYKVVEYIETGDGLLYMEGIKNFTKDFPGVYDKFIKKQEQPRDSRDEITRKYLKMYVEENNLDIKYYQEYGWDPVEI